VGEENIVEGPTNTATEGFSFILKEASGYLINIGSNKKRGYQVYKPYL